MARLSLKNVTKRFGDAAAVDRVSLEVEDGGFLALLGPSGCGKTTILRMIAGFERLTSGEIAFDDRLVSAPDHHVPAEKRRVGIVFQSYALWPHMSVAGNIGYPLRVARIRGEEYRRRIATALATVGLDGFGERRPAELSGGQRQRVALARCLVMEPSLVLLDEPLANLDVHLRAAMEDEFAAFHKKTRATMIYVTHDQAEAMALAHRIAVMDHGHLVQVAEPRTLYREPATIMVAGFIGQGAVVEGRVAGGERDSRCPVEVFGATVSLRCRPGQPPGPVSLCLRPEDLELARDGIPGRVRKATYKGGIVTIEVAPDAAPTASLVIEQPSAPEPGVAVVVRIRDGWVIPD